MAGLTVETDVRMTTRDGVELAADVYRPAGPGRHPVLLHRTPYDRTNPTLVSAIVVNPLWLARRGYAVVVQDVRGRFGSGGRMEFFTQEHDDGYDAVDWAAAQPWSSGRVGIYVSSYHALTTYQAVAARPPSLGAALALVGATDLARTVRPGGPLELGFLAYYALGQSLEAIRRLDVPAGRRAELAGRVLGALGRLPSTVATLPVADIDVLADPDVVPDWARWVDRGPTDPAWAGPTLAAEPERVGVPLLQVVGFRDFMQPTMLELAGRLAGDPRHRLVAGPWTHTGTYSGHVGARAYPGAPAGVGVWGPLVLGWFDRWLRAGEGSAPAPPLVARWLDGEPVHWFSTGDDTWHSAAAWPPPSTTTAWYLAPGGRLAAQPLAGEPVRYRSDPLDPVPTCGGALTQPQLGPDGVQDRRAVAARADVLVFDGEPLAEPVRVAGRVRVVVHLASTAPDVDVVAHLVDVEPGGYAVGVSEGVVRARHRRGGDDAFLASGVVTELAIELHQTAHTFRAGHRIRLELAGSDFPRFSRNLHTRGVPERAAAADAVAEQAVHLGPAQPSRLELATVPAP